MAGIVNALPMGQNSEKALVRVTALLREYIQADTAQSVIEVAAEDWLDALQPFPDWAICRACRRWQGVNTPDRRKKPLIGDIVEICRNKVALVALARKAIARPAMPIADHPSERERVTAERAAALTREIFDKDRDMGDVGRPKRMP